MTIRKLTVSVPVYLGKFVDYKVNNHGYGSISEYIRELIRLDQRFELAQMDRLIMPNDRTREQRRNRDPHNIVRTP